MLRTASRFRLLASLVFVISLCGFLGMRWVADTRISAARPSIPAIDTSASETMAAYDSAHTRTKPVVRGEEAERYSGIAARLMSLLDKKNRSLPADAEKEISAALANHEKWVEEFFHELHSPDSAIETDDAEEAGAGIISGLAQTFWGDPIEGVPVTATRREYFRTTTSVAPDEA